MFMPFGKRAAAPSSPSTSGVGRLKRIAAAERLERLRDELSALFATAQKVVDTVREQGLIHVPGVGDETDPEAGPFVLKGFAQHFVTRSLSGVGHVGYGYQRPNGEGAIDPNAQFHLQQVIGDLLAFNLYCQRAAMDDALGVALQSPDVADKLDGMLVRLGFFAAFFDNMVLSRRDGAAASPEDLERQRTNIERHLLMAQDKMLDPSRLDARVPSIEWPFVGIEIPFEPHDGDYFINSVYFPAEHAAVLLSAQQTVNTRSDVEV
jgi:hypothetical protein